jgi:FlaG/FlaF family flagellin (archaellin)
MIYTKFHKRRAVSETIGTLLILVVTVLGAVLVANFVRDGFFSANQNPSTIEHRANSLQLTGYDTRDSDSLTDVFSLDNYFNEMLCTQGNSAQCTVTPLTANNIPSASGTEFIVLKVRNMNVNSVYLHNILINNVGHTWDSGTANNDFDASIAGVAGTTYPTAGEFSIIPVAEKTNPTRQASTNEVLGDEEVRVIVKLSNSITQDIEMWDSLLILVNFGGSQPAEYIVLSGDAKW